MSAGALSLLRFIPLPNLDGTARNFHYVTTNATVSDSVSLRVTHNFTPNVAGRGGPGLRGGGRGGFGGGRAGRGAGRQGTSVLMNAQFQYRRNNSDQNNVFPTLGGTNTSSSLAVPVSLNIQHKRNLFNVNVNYARTNSHAINQYAFAEDVAGLAGITGVSTDPFDWGVPQLSFSSLSSVRDLSPSRRTDTRLTVAGAWTRPFTKHTLRVGGDLRLDHSNNQTDSNARGAFVFTGLYASGGSAIVRSGGLDFADFLLGLPQQATVQYGPGNVALTGKSMSAYVQDDWRKSNTLTFNLGVRYELMWPFVEAHGQMVNLDAAPGFTAVAPVLSGGTGPYSGAFPAGLLRADTNNIAPRVGFAWRVKPGTIVRGGYGISYNAGSYSTIARQLVGQPPFAVTDTAIGTAATPLLLSDPFATASPTDTTNNYGVQLDYALGLVQTWNADISRDWRQAWNVGAGYTEIRGSSLDIVRAPNRGPDGLRIEGVQPFLWQTSEGSSVLHAATFRVNRRPVKGIGGGASYTLAKSRDNASSIGGGGTVVAQDDQNLAAEWGLSSFDRRHQLSANLNVELPFGPNRPWLSGGGLWSSLLRDWRFTTNFTWQSGTPLTARVQASASEVAKGTNGTLRANYNGDAIQLAEPDDRPFLQHGCVRRAGAGHVRHLRTQHHHRAGQQDAQRAVRARRAAGQHARAHDPAERDEPAQPRQLRRGGHHRELTHVRAGPVGPAHAFDATEFCGSGSDMRIRCIRLIAVAVVVLIAGAATERSPSAQQAQPAQQPQAVFRTSRDIISVDVIVRDKSGAVVRGLTAADFEVREDGRPQAIQTFSFEEIASKPVAPIETAELLGGVEAKMREESRGAAAAAPKAAPEPPATPVAMTSDALAGRRLITLVFDVSSMQPEDVERAVESAQKYVSEKMSAADLVAVATVGTHAVAC